LKPVNEFVAIGVRRSLRTLICCRVRGTPWLYESDGERPAWSLAEARRFADHGPRAAAGEALTIAMAVTDR
jgi:hypothetical protein